MTNFVDGVAMTLPWAGGLIPATLTYHNLQVAGGLEPWQALTVAGVVEGLGFVAVTTCVDLYEQFRSEQDGKKPGLLWIALGMAGLYLAAVMVINMGLDPAASAAKIITGGLLSTFGVVGGVMVALRNQLGKLRNASQVKVNQKLQEDADQKALQREEIDRQYQLQLEREREERANEQKIREEKLRLDQEFRLRKLEEKSKKVSESPEEVVKVSESIENVSEIFGKWHDWRKVPESERKVIANLASAEEVQKVYGGSLKTCGNWLVNAKKEFEVAA